MENQPCKLCGRMARWQEEKVKLTIVYETEHVVAYHSDMPFAQVHVFIASKRHIPTIFDITASNGALMADFFAAIQAASQEVIKLKGACKLEMYLGAFQQLKHLHAHVIWDPTVD